MNKLNSFKSQLFAFLLVVVSSFSVHAGDSENNDDFGLQKGDFIMSIGGGKTVYFNDQFELVAPYLVPVSFSLAVHNKIEIGLEYGPTFFADRSNVTFAATTGKKNHNFGMIHAMGGDVKYAVYNDFGVMAYFSGGGKYNIMQKNTYVEGQLQELSGNGKSFTLGFGVRYQIGDGDGDILPWFFDMGIYYSRIDYNITNYKLDGEVQPATSVYWDDLNFGGLDVVIRFGYRLRSKK